MTVSTGFAPDPALPQRDLLLDPAAMAPRLEAAVDSGRTRLRTCAIAHAKYRFGETLRVCYRVGTDDGIRRFSLRAFPGGAPRVSRSWTGLHPPVTLAGLDSVVWAYPGDRKLDLDRFTGDAPAIVALIGVAPACTHLVGYAPEKAATFRCSDAAGGVLAYVKTYAGREHARTLGLYETLIASASADDPGLRLPRVLASSDVDRALALEPLEGISVASVAGNAERRRAYESLGVAAATFHRLMVPTDATFDRFLPHRLLSAARLISAARPDVAAAAHRLAELLERRRPGPDSTVCLHGDLHPKNAVLLGGRVGLIDLDQAAVGPAAAELGGLLAGLRVDRLIGRLTAGEERRLHDAVLAGYSSVRPLPADSTVLWHTSAALLVERAARAVNRLRTLTLRRLAELLEDAERALA